MSSKQQRDAAAAGKRKEHVSVFIRARPLQPGEGKAMITLGDRNVTARTKSSRNESKNFSFKRVFPTDATQEDVFDHACKPLVAEMLKGFSCTVLAYGQTNSGKTHTMMGDLRSSALQGLTPRSCQYIFHELLRSKRHFTVRLSCVELYMEEFYDMLVENPDTVKREKLKLYHDPQAGVVLKGVEEVVVTSAADVLRQLQNAIRRRATAATGMNLGSSRSHFITTISVTSKEETMSGQELFKIGKLHLVDLAGSESAKRAETTGTDRQLEGAAINKSLLTLGRVISSLSSPGSYTPYRDSALTRLLQDALGGRSKTSILTTISLAQVNVDETLSTLEYANSARKIVNDPEMNHMVSSKQIVADYEVELLRLRDELTEQRNANGVMMSQERYEALQVRLRQLEEDQVLKQDEMKACREQLSLIKEKLTETVMRKNAKNVLLAHHQRNEEQFEERMVQLRKREEGMRGVIRTRDACEEGNFEAIASCVAEQQACAAGAEAALQSAHSEMDRITNTANESVAATAETCRTEQGEVGATVEKLDAGVRSSMASISGAVTSAAAAQQELLKDASEKTAANRDALAQSAESSIAGATHALDQATSGHASAMSAAFDAAMQRYIASAGDASAGHHTEVQSVLGGILTQFKAEFVGALTEDTARRHGDAMQHIDDANEAGSEVRRGAEALRDTLASTTAESDAGMVARATALHSNLNQGAAGCADTVASRVKSAVDSYTSLMGCFDEREKAAHTSSAEERQRLHRLMQCAHEEASAEISREVARITQSLHDSLDAMSRDVVQAEVLLEAELRNICAERVKAHEAHIQALQDMHQGVGSDLAALLTAAEAGQRELIEGVRQHGAEACRQAGSTAAACAAAQGSIAEGHAAYLGGLAGRGSSAVVALSDMSGAFQEKALRATAGLTSKHGEATAALSQQAARQVGSECASRCAELQHQVGGIAADTANSVSAALSDAAGGAAGVTATLSRCAEGVAALQQGVAAAAEKGAAEAGTAAASAAEGVHRMADAVARLQSGVAEGMAAGGGSVHSLLQAAEAATRSALQAAAALGSQTEKHARGETPSPMRQHAPLKVDYRAVLAGRGVAELSKAAETPHPGARPRFAIHTSPERGGEEDGDAMAVDVDVEPRTPVRAVPFSPEARGYKKGVDGTPVRLTPLAARSANVA